ncbi:MAG TPA: hypothetical protein VLL27_13535 [Solirubrobacterales bacterium]|nr:hypothetical protein [Solirubrobacterales bacterium]
MIWVLLLLAVAFVVFLAWRNGQSPPQQRDPEAELKAALELHAIRRRLEAAELKHQQRQDAARLRRDIQESLDESDGRVS